jgi:hypothetical protein
MQESRLWTCQRASMRFSGRRSAQRSAMASASRCVARSVNHAAKLDDAPVADALDDAAVVERRLLYQSDRCAARAAAPGCGPRPLPRSGCSRPRRRPDRRELSGLGHSSGSPALRRASNAVCRMGLRAVNHLTLSLGLRRRASARGASARSISSFSAWPAARFR